MKCTVITPLLNRAHHVPTALASVAAQGCAVVEHIVVDGGSNDEGPALCRQSGARVIDRPGSGIYEAINAGLEAARGDVIWLLNSDDRLLPGAVAAALDVLSADATLIARGRAGVERLIDGAWRLTDGGEKNAAAPTVRSVLLQPPNINACAIRRELFRDQRFDARLRISADRAWLATALLSGARCAALDRLVYVYRAHPGSITMGGRRTATETWVREHLTFGEHLLEKPGLSAADRADLQAFLAKETAHLAALLVARGAHGEAVAMLARTLRRSPLFPLHAFPPLLDVAARRLHRLLPRQQTGP